MFQRRYFIRAEARAKVATSNQNLLLGRAWLILGPLLDAGVYGLIFGVLLKTSRGIEHFIPFLLIGVTFFGFSSKALNAGSGLISARKNFIKAFAFPRAALVLSQSLKLIYDSIPMVLVALAVTLWFPQGIGWPFWTWLLLPVVWGLQAIFNTGLIFVGATLTDALPDLKRVISYATRIWFYSSGVFFSVDAVVSGNPILRQLVNLNPAYWILDMARDLVVYGEIPTLAAWLRLVAWALGTLLFGFLLFWAREESYGKG
ncbi:ABC transporter permease [Corynebacterium choanae]|uniref:ABC transporter permease n=1 Tax=Corynebacterium choanae TaxID=1862358 RepID=UPI0013DDB373|nr:ABC transporter permease [Corynebacterium choanae]